MTDTLLPPLMFRLTGMVKTGALAGLLMLALAPVQARDKAPRKVLMATDSWAHLMYLDEHKRPAGALADFVRRMNAVQDKFHFELSIYPRLRLDDLFIARKADVYPARTLAWVSPKLELLATQTLFDSGDVYFARKTNHFGGAKVFDALHTRMIAGVRGYHYKLFQNNADEDYINARYKAYLLSSNEAVVQYVLADRADIGIVPEAILVKYMKDPATRDQLIVGGFDSHVQLSNLVRKGGPISVAEMNEVIALLVKSGDVEKLREQLTLPGLAAPK